jgi:hypothetical protein
MIKILHDYGLLAGRWHVTRDVEARAVTVVQSKKKSEH